MSIIFTDESSFIIEDIIEDIKITARTGFSNEQEFNKWKEWYEDEQLFRQELRDILNLKRGKECSERCNGKYKGDYHEYLKTDEWKDKRNERLRLDNHICTMCGGDAANVHHKNYNSIFNENMEDITSLCLPCHKAQHGK